MAESSREEIAKLEALYANNPGGRVFTHLAEAYRKAGELDRARRILEDGIARHTDYASAQVVLGRVLLDLGESDDATAAFRRVLQLDPENRVAVRALGDLAHANGREAEALTHYRHLLALDPTDDQLRRRVEELLYAPPQVEPEAEPEEQDFTPVESAPEAEAIESDEPAPASETAADEPLAIESAAETAAPSLEQTITSDFSLGWDTAEDEESDELPGDLARLVGGPEAAAPLDTPVPAEDPMAFDPGMPIDLGPVDEPEIENAGDFEVDLTADPETPPTAAVESADLVESVDMAENADAAESSDAAENADAAESSDAAENADAAEAPESTETVVRANLSELAESPEMPAADAWQVSEPAASPDATAEPWESAAEVEAQSADAGIEPQAEDAEPWMPADVEPVDVDVDVDIDPWAAAADVPAVAPAEAPADQAGSDSSMPSGEGDELAAEVDELTAQADESTPAAFADPVVAPEVSTEEDDTPSVFAERGGDASEWIVGEDAIMDVVRRAEPEAMDRTVPAAGTQEPSFEALLSSSRAAGFDDDEPQPTETLAELYRAQGFDDQAAAVYRALLNQRPDDPRLQQKLAEVEERGAFHAVAGASGEAQAEDEVLDALESAWIDAGGPQHAEPSPFSWTDEADAESGSGPSIGEYFAGLLGWKPANGGIPEKAQAEAGPSGPEPLDELVLEPVRDAVPGLAESAGELVVGAEPVEELMLEAVEVSATPETTATPTESEPWEMPLTPAAPAIQVESTPVAPTPPPISSNPVDAAFDEWFSAGPPAAPAAPAPEAPPVAQVAPEPVASAEVAEVTGTRAQSEAAPQPTAPALDDGEDDSDDDLEMFRSWLQSLKR